MLILFNHVIHEMNIILDSCTRVCVCMCVCVEDKHNGK